LKKLPDLKRTLAVFHVQPSQSMTDSKLPLPIHQVKQPLSDFPSPTRERWRHRKLFKFINLKLKLRFINGGMGGLRTLGVTFFWVGWA